VAERNLEGGCLCGDVRYRITGNEVGTAYCHCSMCRRASSAAAVAWAVFHESQVAFTKQTPAVYESSPGCTRGFCARCGSPIYFRGGSMPGFMDVTICSLDDPASLPPAMHIWDSSRVAWVRFDDDLPRYPESLPSPGE
jgi:hypothetical protein